MAKYLDYAGLQYLWTKIKNYVSTQPLGANVRYDAQTLTTTQQEQARQNIAAANTNPNLIDNGWFNVNSRNVNGAVNGGQIGLDRWVVNASASNSVTMATGSITLPSAGYEVIQYLNDMTSTYGKYVTLSVKDNSGSIYSASVVMPTSPSTQNYINSTQGGIRMRLRYTGSYWWVMLDANSAGTDVTIKAVKLELGSFSTLVNDTTPDYATELARCIYSTANSADTYANNGFGRTNPNLIDNPWFTIHQMGTSGHTGVGYGVDRWKIRAGTGCTVTPKTNYGITVSYTTTFDITYCFWIPPAVLAGKTYTLSLMINGNVVSATGEIGTANQYYFGISDTTNNIRARVGALSTIGSGNLIINIEPLNSSGTINIDAVKLELGSVSTLANDTPPDYGTELAKCQYYFRRILCTGSSYVAIGYSVAGTEFRFVFPFAMRTTPSISFSGALTAYYSGGNSSITALATRGVFSGFVSIGATTTGLTAGNIVSLSMANNAYIDLSADL